LERLAEKEAFWWDAEYLHDRDYPSRCLKWPELEIAVVFPDLGIGISLPAVNRGLMWRQVLPAMGTGNILLAGTAWQRLW
jgi:hypothetical protein